MSKWLEAIEKPPEGIIIAVLNIHWKKQGWLSAELNFGRVLYHKKDWYVSNNDERGYGGEFWEPNKNFSHWIRVTDLPDLPTIK